ncbi:hamartin [Condylostylus longicornis]|uniref:hamartin n=1 Tax=Condylostylus longicornis TaxID=2530218 RepID=UPI00244E5293|nr:hamartin [Condylostylus longicornis]XP_055384529.1 hamartin [Condylostylus longicornis]
MDPEKLFNGLESSNVQEYDESKQKIAEFFIHSKDPWLVQGMMDYYLKTNSARILEVIVKVQQPHDNYVFDRLSEWMRNHNRIAALTLFGFIVRKHPTWLHKVAKHKLMKDILKLLQSEKEIVPLMSALLCIITLLPIIPSSTNLLSELFDVFGHLASWNFQNPNRLTQYQIIHLQIGLHMLFHRLYGMYPWHFISFLKDFVNKEKGAIYHHTIKPLLETVRIHPLLITGSKESEANIGRWRDMQPHDVVIECAKLSLAFYNQDNTDNLLASSVKYKNALLPTQVLQTASVRNTPFQPITSCVSSPLHYLMQRENITDLSKFSERQIWSPQLEILATPPPTGAIPHTPTPHYVVPSVSTSTDHSMTTNSLLNVSGSSPPEAAVEATPETTPLKDISIKRSMINKPGAVRAILPTSQPSSPMRKEQSPFNFPTMITEQNFAINSHVKFSTTTTTTTATNIGPNPSSQRFMKIINDRSFSNTFGSGQRLYSNTLTKDLNIGTVQSAISNSGKFISANQSLDSPTLSTELDLEVTTLTSQQGICASSGAFGDTGPHHSDTLQDISNEYGECDENEQSLCSVGGLHVPAHTSMQMLVNHLKRRSCISTYCSNDNSCYLSCGTIPINAVSLANENFPYITVIANAKLRRTRSWPIVNFNYYNYEDGSINIADQDIFVNEGGAQQNGASKITQGGNSSFTGMAGGGGGNDSSSPSGDDVMSAATHFKLNRIQQKKDRKDVTTANFAGNKTLISKFTGAHNLIKEKSVNAITKSCVATQTIEQWPHIYEHNLLELFEEETKMRKSFQVQEILQPREILDKFLEVIVKTKHPTEQKTRDDEYREQIQLLYLQLQYAEYRREIHAERNRRLMGRSRDKKNLELENDRIRDQLRHLEKENATLIMESKETRKSFNEKEQKLLKEATMWKNKYQNELDENKQLRFNFEELQKKLHSEIKNCQNYKNEIDNLKGEFFDTRQDLENTRYQAELGLQYKEDLAKLQSEFMIMGEVQVKCKEHFSELESLRARDEELKQLKEIFKLEIHELRSNLEEKIPQLESAKYRLTELQQQLVNKEMMFTDQKRLLKAVKDEYEEKFAALNKKYEAQKSIILQMEQKMLELNRNRAISNALSPESERIDIASSVDRTSPLSTSLASSEGLSASLRSVTDLCNLQAIATATNSNSLTTTTITTVAVVSPVTTLINTSSPQKFSSIASSSVSSVAVVAVSASSSLLSNDGINISTTTVSNPSSNSNSSASPTAPLQQQSTTAVRNRSLPLSQQLQQHQILTTTSSTSVRFNSSLNPTTATIAAAAAVASTNYQTNSSNTSNIPVPGPSQQHHRNHHHHHHHHQQYSTHHR